MIMERITIFSEGELRRMMDGNIVVGEDTDGIRHLYMSKSEYENIRMPKKETKDG